KLLALRTDEKKGEPTPEIAKVMQGAWDYLEGAQDEAHSAMSLAWTVLALSAYSRSYEKPLQRLLAKQNKDGSFGPNVMTAALSALALNAASDEHPFKMAWLQGDKWITK